MVDLTWSVRLKKQKFCLHLCRNVYIAAAVKKLGFISNV